MSLDVSEQPLEEDFSWLSFDKFQPDKLGNPITCEILKLEVKKTEKGITKRLILKHKNDLYKADIWGTEYNKLREKLGTLSSMWTSKKLRIMLIDGNYKKYDVVD